MIDRQHGEIVRECRNCGTVIVRRPQPSGRMESPAQFAARKFCDRDCMAQAWRVCGGDETMIDREYGSIVFACDGCDSTIETGERDWPDAMAQFRASGWRAEKVGEDWIHLCPRCRDLK